MKEFELCEVIFVRMNLRKINTTHQRKKLRTRSMTKIAYLDYLFLFERFIMNFEDLILADAPAAGAGGFLLPDCKVWTACEVLPDCPSRSCHRAMGGPTCNFRVLEHPLNST
ncbi:uncharacterized protein LOC107863879 isoform X2 [Capsicum annuum]|nr:uncharacterized protein LOC107863879 isoform X2 [Capsicum annuum]